MSDQPTGQRLAVASEWTVEYLMNDLCRYWPRSEGMCAKIADAHNAALAAVAPKLRQNLHDVFVERDNAQSAYRNELQAHAITEKQLAAEREKVTLATQMVQIESKRANEAEQKMQTLVELLEQVLSETVDASVYPDGPCLDASTRTEINDALAKAKVAK